MTDPQPTCPDGLLWRSAAWHAMPAILALLAAGSALANVFDLGSWFVAQAAFAFVAIAGLFARWLPSHAPHTRFGAANAVTLGRLALTCLMLALIGASSPAAPSLAVSLALLVVALDGVDGWIARRSGLASPFGARFDMETDAVLIMGLAVLAWLSGKAGVWVLAAGLLRYVFVAAGERLTWLQRPLPPSQRRKTACVVQIVTLIASLAPALEYPTSAWIAGGGLVFLCYSFVVDVLWLYRHSSASEA